MNYFVLCVITRRKTFQGYLSVSSSRVKLSLVLDNLAFQDWIHR
jgi:hypothetical protein